MSVPLNKNYFFTLDLGKAIFNFSSDTLYVAFTDTAPTTATHVYTDIVSPLATTNISGGATSLALGSVTWAETTGTATLGAANLTITSVTGNFGPFRYIVLYDNTASSKNILGWYDYGSEVTLQGANGDQFVINFSSNILTLA